MSNDNITRADTLRASLIGRLPSPQPTEFKVVQVEIGYSEVLQDYVDELYEQYSIGAHPRTLPFTKEELTAYTKSLVQQRVANVIGKGVFIRAKDGHAVPAMLSVVLEMIGVCSDASTGINLEPVLDSDLSKHKVDVDFMKMMSLKLRNLERLGFVFAQGLPRPREGDFDFMSFAVIEGVVKHMKGDKPEAYAVCAAMLNITGLTTFFGKAVYNIDYGTTRELGHFAKELAQPRM